MVPTSRHEVTSLLEFTTVVLERLASPFQTMRGTWIYRGQTDHAWPLAPQILRQDFKQWRAWHPGLKATDQEQELMRAFKVAAIAHTPHGPPSDDWSWLALAQHHGLATRLLDWSYNPQVALYFAVRQPESASDSAVWCYKPSDTAPTASEIERPYAAASIVFFEPPHVSPRISVQSGCFTSHPIDRPDQPWDGVLVQLVIPKAARAQVRRELFRVGVHEQGLFPDLDGLARQTNWRYATYPDERPLHP